jgi:hypothetical protein
MKSKTNFVEAMKGPIQVNDAILSVDEDQILHIKFLPKSYHTLQKALDNLDAEKKLFEDDNYYCLTIVDIRNVVGVSKEVRAMAKTDLISKNHEAFALIVGSSLSRLIANFFLGINKPKVPIRMFEDSLKAKEWLLKTYRK